MSSPAAGIDIGGTRIKSVLMASDGTVLVEQTRPTPDDLAQNFGPVIAQVQRDLEDAHPVAPIGIGVAVPGLIDGPAGIALWAANLGWHDLDVPSALAPYTALPVELGHDVRCGLLAEHRFGAAGTVQHALFVPIGTGIASALLVGGTMVTGAAWSGEIGHVVVEPGGFRCNCGQSGCLETVASASAIGRRWRAAGHTGDAATVAEAVAEGDGDARVIWSDAVQALAAAIAPVVAAAGLQAVVIGGGLARAGDVLLHPLAEAISARLGELAPVRVLPAVLGDRAGSLGAALLGHAAGSGAALPR